MTDNLTKLRSKTSPHMAYLTSQAKPATQGLFQALSELSRLPVEERDDITIARLKREAEKLRNADAQGSYMALGALAALKWNVEQLRHNHEASLRGAGASRSNALFNYSASLQQVALMDEAAEKLIEAHGLEREDPYLLETAIRTNLHAGRMGDVKELLDRLHKLDQEQFETLKFINQIFDLMDREDLANDGVHNICQCIFGLLHERQVGWISARFEARDNEELILAIHVLTKNDVATNLNEEISFRVSDSNQVPPQVFRVITGYYVGIHK